MTYETPTGPGAQEGSGWQPPYPGSPEPLPKRNRNMWIYIGAAAGAVCLAVILAVALSGGNSSKTSTSGQARPSPNAASTPSGYQTFSDQADRFSIAVPSSWRQIDPSSPGASQAFSEIEAANPSIKAAIGPDISSLAAEGMKFLTVAPVAVGGVAPNLNVVVRSALGFTDSDLDQVAAELPGEYAKLGGTFMGTERTTLAGHQALKATVDLPLNTGTGTKVTIPEIQYVLGGNDLLYIISLGGNSPDLQTIASTFRVK